ncbi:MAG: hypothetical protein J7K68_02340 [Candidatus Diapherotrites archaeon]|nr:hypothetical protein [Candidatus Diapherotrites archaeon]
MKWNTRDMLEKAKENFGDQWIKTIDFIPKGVAFTPKERRGERLLVFEIASQLRSMLIDRGFDEFSLPLFVGEKDVRKMYNIETPLALQYHNHISLLKKEYVQITEDVVNKIKEVAPSFNEKRKAQLEEMLEQYKRNELHGTDLKRELVERLGVRMEQASRIIAMLFSDNKLPDPTTLMLRSDVQSSWFETIAVMLKKEPLPLQMFSYGIAFRRIDDVDENELRGYPTISGVVVDENISDAYVMELIKELLTEMGTEQIEFEKEIATNAINIPGTEHSIIAENHLGKRLKVGKIAMYSPIALSEYGIEYPTMSFVFALEKMAMLFGNIENPKKALYPQFYGEWTLTDKEIAELIREKETPHTELGREISKKIVKTCELYSTQKSPCEFKVFEKEVGDNKLEVWVVEEKEGSQLCGPAYINEVYVYDGNILALPPSGFDEKPLVKETRAKGIKTGVRLINAFADYCAARIEKEPTKQQRFQVKNIRDPDEVNVDVPLIVRRYINSKGKVLNVRGPMFVTVETRIKRLWVHEQPR